MGYFYIFLTLVFTVYGQLVLKWQIAYYGALPGGLVPNIQFLLKLFLNPWILSGFISAFLASLAWMATMTKFELSFAYPFMSLAFIFVLMFSMLFLNEPMSFNKISGTLLVMLGLYLVTR